VIGTGGSLSGSGVALNSSTVIDLTSKGTADWIVFPPRQSWNLPNDDDYSGTVRKAGVPPQISPYHPIARVSSSGCGGAQFTFEDGLPDPQEAVGCYVSSSAASGSGFEFKVSAYTTPRTLRVYLGVANAQGKLIAFLSDGSAPAILDESVQSNSVNTAFVYTINFSAASAGQTLTVRWIMDQAFDPYFGYLLYGSLSLYAATLNGPPAQAPIEISGVDPASGAVGTLVTITGTGFGASPGSVAIGGTPMNIVSWTDSSIVASVASGTTTGTLTVQQGSNWAKGPTFTVYTLGGTPPSGLQVSPSSLNMLVGQSRTVSVTDNGQPVTHLGWATTNSSVVSLSSDDPPLITAVAPGSATVYAGDVPIPVTVYAGSALPPGTPLWSVTLSSSGSGAVNIVPAVPNQSSDVDLFVADSNSHNLSAISSDGSVLWSVPSIWSGTDATGATVPITRLIPDFSGNVLLKSPYSYLDQQGFPHSTHVLQKVNPTTGQLTNLYTFADRPIQCAPPYGTCFWDVPVSVSTSPYSPELGAELPGEVAVPHPSGVLFIQDIPAVGDFVCSDLYPCTAAVSVLDPSTGTTLARINLENSTNTAPEASGGSAVAYPPGYGKMIVAGDGNAYLPYAYYNQSSTGFESYQNILRISPDGTYAKIQLNTIDSAATGSYLFPYVDSAPCVITNGGTGIAAFAVFITYSGSNGSFQGQLSYISQDSVTLQANNIQTNSGCPTLQREDGSYIATDGQNTLIVLAPDGSQLWSQQIGTAPITPLYATSDGGVIVTNTPPGPSVSPGPDGTLFWTNQLISTQLGTLYTVDQNGNVTSQTPDTGAVLSWTGNSYGVTGDPLVVSYGLASIHLTESFWASKDANPSATLVAGIRELVYMRSFAPWPWFGPEVVPDRRYLCSADCFAGDNRSFTTATYSGTTSRITGIVKFVVPGMVVIGRYAYSDPSYDKFGRTATGIPTISTTSNGTSLHMEFAGSNPLVPGAPDINTKLDMSGQTKSGQVCLSGHLYGDAFPNAEVFIVNSQEQPTMLLTFATPYDRNLEGPARLFGNNNRDMGSFPTTCVAK